MKSTIIGYEVFYVLRSNSKEHHKKQLYSIGDLSECREQALTHFVWLQAFCGGVHSSLPNEYTIICRPVYDIDEYNVLVPPIAISKPGLLDHEAHLPEVLMAYGLDIGMLLSYGQAMEALHLPHYGLVETTALFEEIKQIAELYVSKIE